ncbi:MAG TPA: class I SAM-dependent methyltransferase [Kineosporiaceae bacterium]
MARWHLFEFEDQAWLPGWIRAGTTDFLRTFIVGGRVYASVVPILQKVLRHAGTDQVVDLCSGGSGPWTYLHADLAAAGNPVKVIFTDRFPDHAALRQAASAIDPDHTRYEQDPVDARAVPARLTGVRTIFSALHHFRPDDAAGIMRDAYRRREGIAAFEMSQRRITTILGTLVIVPFMVLTTTPRQRPGLLRLLLTYPLPVIPIVTAWDGVVSNLRTYSIEELRALVAGLDNPDYAWETGTIPRHGLDLPISYLIGYPLARSSCMGHDR